MGLIQEFIENENPRNKSEGKMRMDDGILYSYGHHFPLMIHLGEFMLINADKRSDTTSRHQGECNYTAKNNGIAVPFSALDAAGVQLYSKLRYKDGLKEIQNILKIVDFKPPRYETKQRKDPKTGKMVEYQEHTLGASLIRFKQVVLKYNTDPTVIGHPPPEKRTRYFLSGIDETGTSRRGNYFLTELKKSAKTVDEAYEQLKPKELKGSLNFVRQGEYFFVPTDFKKRLVKSIKQFKLPDQSNQRTESSHTATEAVKIGEIIFVRGTVRHSRKEHKMLDLGKTWHAVYHNNQKRSFNANGGFD